jgi:hypothetical protein
MAPVCAFAAFPVDLFAVDGPKTPSFSRPALTRTAINGVEYCLAPEGVTAGGVCMCKKCASFVARRKLPKLCLVSCDTGRRPVDLPIMTVIEELICAVLRVNRYTCVARPVGAQTWRSRDTFVPFLMGHIFAVPNPPLKEWQDMLTPLDPAALVEYINVFLLYPARNAAEARRMAAKIRCLQVRPRVVAAWVPHLMRMYRENGNFADLVHRISCSHDALLL